MRRALSWASGLIVLLCLSSSSLPAADPPPFWMPAGYHLLIQEELVNFPPEQVNAIRKRNSEILTEALDHLSPTDIEALSKSLATAGDRPVSREETMYHLQLMAEIGKRLQKVEQRDAQERQRPAFEELLRWQEESTGGFPGDADAVEAEASRIREKLAVSSDRAELYRQVLPPLRARPWNESVRVTFRKILRGEMKPDPQGPTLYHAALEFIRHREQENPAEGAWDSLEGFLLLSFEGKVDAAERLFARAIEKNANEVESRVFPLLLAEIAGDEAAVARLRPRAAEAWPDPADLDRVLLDSMNDLPEPLREKAHKTYEQTYKRAHPTDWEARVKALESALGRGASRQVEAETTQLLAPASAAEIPETWLAELRGLSLRAQAAQGRCADALARLPAFEAAAVAAYPSAPEPSNGAGRGHEIAAFARQEVAKCFLQGGDPAAAAHVAEGCVDAAPSLRPECIRRFHSAGVALAQRGDVAAAVRIHARLRGLDRLAAQNLALVINEAAPGTIPPP